MHRTWHLRNLIWNSSGNLIWNSSGNLIWKSAICKGIGNWKHNRHYSGEGNKHHCTEEDGVTVQGVEKKQCDWHLECDRPHIAGTTLLLIYLPRFHPKNRKTIHWP
jgi:hypothetical protein